VYAYVADYVIDKYAFVGVYYLVCLSVARESYRLVNELHAARALVGFGHGEQPREKLLTSNVICNFYH